MRVVSIISSNSWQKKEKPKCISQNYSLRHVYSPRNCFCCLFAHLDYSKMSIIMHIRNQLVPTLWLCELSEGGQGDEGVGHRVHWVQNTGDVIGLTRLYTANGVRAFKPHHSKGVNKHTHPQKKENTNTHGL